jgi:hypothetical protein
VKKRNLNLIPYVIIFLAIAFTIITNRFLLPFNKTSRIFPNFLPFNNIRYGQYIAQKLFLVLIGLIFFIYWIIKKNNIFKILKKNIIPIALIAIVLFITRIYSYQHWFYRDDYYIIQQFMDKTLLNGTINNQYIPCCGTGYYPTAVVYLIMHWFTNNFFLYKTFGLVLYFFLGITVFAIAKKIQNKSIIALLAALFFITTPTYFQETLLVGEFIGDAFALLIYLFSVYLLLDDFIPGTIILAAAALEMGLTRTHFIAVPLILLGLLFVPRIQKNKKLLLSLITIPLISLLYVPILMTSQANTYGTILPSFEKILVIFDSILSISVPFSTIKGIVYSSQWFFVNPTYVTVALGFILISILSLITLILFIKKNYKVAKIFLIGLISLIAADIVPAMWGIRVNQDVKTLTSYYLDNKIPSGATGYGLFPSIGLVFIFIGFSYLIKPKLFKILAIFIIVFNMLTFITSDKEWINEYSGKQRHVNDQLTAILPEDGKPKLIFVPQNKNHLYLGIIYYQQILRVNEPITEVTEPEKFIEEAKKQKIPKDHLYILNMNEDSWNIYDFSQRLRNVNPNKYLQILTAADKEKI